MPFKTDIETPKLFSKIFSSCESTELVANNTITGILLFVLYVLFYVAIILGVVYIEH